MTDPKNSADSEFALEAKLDRVDQLVSLLLDEAISETETQELEELLLALPEARSRYIEGVHIHADLIEHFRPAGDKKRESSPVLGFLGPDTGEVGFPTANPSDPA